MKNSQAIKDLFERYLRKECSPAEKDELFRLLADPANEKQFQAINEALTAWPAGNVQADRETTEQVWMAIEKGVLSKETNAPVKNTRKTIVMRWSMAAAACILIVAAAWILMSRPETVPAVVIAKPEIRPGSQGAVLTLADGKTITLDSLQTGWTASQQGVGLQLQHGQLTYQQADSVSGSVKTVAYNTVTTPRGRHFQLVLADGTRVWLNAASSLRYPASFSGDTRKVEVNGEAYFEVAPNARKPFIVQVQDKAEIKVLGTHFNVNAYADEASITTTLLEGKVKIAAGGTNKNKFLLPGQECVLQGNHLQVNTADVETAVAWMKGIFNFKSADLGKVMRHVARWYDVQIEMDKSITAQFSGNIYRSENFYELLRIVEFASNVQCKVDGKKVIVSPK